MTEIARKTYYALESLKNPGTYWCSEWSEFCDDPKDADLMADSGEAHLSADWRKDEDDLAARVVEVEMIVREKSTAPDKGQSAADEAPRGLGGDVGSLSEAHEIMRRRIAKAAKGVDLSAFRMPPR